MKQIMLWQKYAGLAYIFKLSPYTLLESVTLSDRKQSCTVYICVKSNSTFSHIDVYQCQKHIRLLHTLSSLLAQEKSPSAGHQIFRIYSSRPMIPKVFKHPTLHPAKISGMPAERCFHLAQVGKRTTAYSPPSTFIIRFGSEVQHHASPQR